MNRQEAEAYVYRSYLRAEKYLDRDARDSQKRRPDLTRDLIRAEQGTPCVVVTGSKGKGSVSNMISQILQTRYKVGLMTSPHLEDFCERFKVNGENITDADFIRYMERLKPVFDRIDAGLPENVCISPMGIQALLALKYFHDKQTGFNVFECGKGAEYDDVNNIVHDYAVINSIFPEHTRELGSTVAEIAADKAHVINGEQKCVYAAEQSQEVMEVIRRRAEAFSVRVRTYGEDFRAENITYTGDGMRFDVITDGIAYRDIIIPLMGEHQAKNCALAFALCSDVSGMMDLDAVRSNLRAIDWPGRMEVLSSEPFVMLDACIHSASCGNVKSVLKHLGITKATVIIGIPDDKDYAGVARSMNETAGRIILTRSQNVHYVFTSGQKEVLDREGIRTEWTDSIEEALSKAVEENEPVIILGTTSLVSEVKKLQTAGKLSDHRI